MDDSSSGNIPEGFVKEPDENVKIEEEETPENIFEALGRCGLFSQETDKIPDIVAFDDNIFNEEYYRKKHGKTFPDEWYAIMAQVSKKKFDDMRNTAKSIEKINGEFKVSFDDQPVQNDEVVGEIKNDNPQGD